MLGRPWLPPQRAIAEVAGELLPDGSYAYQVVAVTMPRQSSKSTTAYDVALGRGRALRDFRVKYATHKGTITSERFVDWFLEIERLPRVAAQMKLRRSRGTESIGWRRTGSYFQAFPAIDGALRSAATNMVVVDEAQEHDAVTGKSLKEMINATFNTRVRHQLWIVFSAGTDASVYAQEYLERGKAGDPLVALFDYGCPEDVDPLDPDLWHTWHPGLAYGLTNRNALELARADDEAAFVREYGNIWTRTVNVRVIPADAWASVQAQEPMPAGRLCFALDVSADRTAGVIAVGGPGRHVEIVELRPGTEWMPQRALELSAAHGAPIVLDSVGAVGTVKDVIERMIPTWQRDRDLLVMKTQDVANAAAGFLDAVLNGTLRVWPHPALTAAVEVALTRPLGDSGFAWDRRRSSESIAPLVAASAALWGSEHLPPTPARPSASAG